MTEIKVNVKELKKFSGQMEANSVEFGIITKNMRDIVESLKRRGWSGYDADSFIKNATEYLTDLKIVEDALFESSVVVKDRNKKYESRIEDYYEATKARRDDNDEQYFS